MTNGGGWWSSSVTSASTAWFRGLNAYISDINRNGNERTVGFSVRCLQD